MNKFSGLDQKKFLVDLNINTLRRKKNLTLIEKLSSGDNFNQYSNQTGFTTKGQEAENRDKRNQIWKDSYRQLQFQTKDQIYDYLMQLRNQVLDRQYVGYLEDIDQLVNINKFIVNKHLNTDKKIKEQKTKINDFSKEQRVKLAKIIMAIKVKLLMNEDLQ
ncbi:UNKNOWN [Stylonychia lemnae]|uniref:Uncharacterized protein n=1 Tax=Stylonychia lemnae TaxID=5949 RepID=A0A078ALE0_STYLE|nr:UNKNOWN [Stylonychia lemnae]|eukprot:CDW83175.1 UNKNOWN [Stylonychia lemnae]